MRELMIFFFEEGKATERSTKHKQRKEKLKKNFAK